MVRRAVTGHRSDMGARHSLQTGPDSLHTGSSADPLAGEPDGEGSELSELPGAEELDDADEEPMGAPGTAEGLVAQAVGLAGEGLEGARLVDRYWRVAPGGGVVGHQPAGVSFIKLTRPAVLLGLDPVGGRVFKKKR